jgi:hypothetical protein|tara:strand:- start:405 stop:830 length:426 start_codon:yes stop_codon:yes gene_type:complete
MSNFDVQAGNGRLYRLSEDKKAKELARLKDLRENKGQAWAKDDVCHDYDGFLQIGQNYINWLQEGLNQAGTELMRMNWKAKLNKDSGTPVLQISGAWIGNGMMDLKQFTDSGGGTSAPSSTSAPQKTAAPVEDFLDDDLPF